MLWAVVLLSLSLLAGLVIALYVAFPHRGQAVPYAPQVGTAMRSAVDSLPTLDPEEVRAGRS